jgi:hypothetical protein
MPPDMIQSVLGPYESWLFDGDNAKFAGKDAALGKDDQIAALAEISPTHWLADAAAPPTDGNAGAVAVGDAIAAVMGGDLIAFRPQIWQPMVDAAKKDLAEGKLTNTDFTNSLFVPLVLRSTKADPDREQVWANLGGRLSGLLGFGGVAAFGLDLNTFDTKVLGGQLPTGAKKLGGPIGQPPSSNPEHGVRLNGKLPRGCFDGSYAAKPRTPDIKADPDIKAMAEQSVGAQPLCLLAVIDDGLAFAHPALMDARGRPRMECSWHQAAEPAQAGTGTVLFGREHLRDDIAKLMHECRGDEDRLYREAGLFASAHGAHPLSGRTTHGAHVLSLAAGESDDDDRDTLDRIRLIGVELPSALMMDTVGFGKDAFVLAAFHYIFDRAERIAKAYDLNALPLVINFSFGFTGGPHDGTDRLEAAIRALIEVRNKVYGEGMTQLVMPAGNHFQARLHGVVTSASGDENGNFTIPWRIQPDDRTSNYLEIWYPDGRNDQPGAPFLEGPDGRRIEQTSERISIGQVQQSTWDIVHDGAVVGQVTLDKFRGHRWRMVAILCPTDAAGADWQACPAGLWKITIKAIDAGEGEITCRIQRDQTARGTRYGRQSYFEHARDKYLGPDDQPLATDDGAVFVRRFGSLNGLATQPLCKVVAGYRDFAAAGNKLPASYSSAGTGQPGAAFVDLAAASDTSPARPGIRCAGSRAGVTGRLRGTSAAAPQAARMVALGHVMPPSKGPRPQPPQTLLDRLGKEFVYPPSRDRG